jgi:hypothetical protein
MSLHFSGRSAAGIVSLCLVLILSASLAEAVPPQQISPGDIGGGTLCKSCGPNVNVQQKSGTATGGYANQNSNGSTNVGMGYATPNDGTAYSGTASIIVTDIDGNLVTNFTSSISDYGNGVQMFTGLDGTHVPIGGSISIRVSEGNWNGASFSAGWDLQNFQP